MQALQQQANIFSANREGKSSMKTDWKKQAMTAIARNAFLMFSLEIFKQLLKFKRSKEGGKTGTFIKVRCSSYL